MSVTSHAEPRRRQRPEPQVQSSARPDLHSTHSAAPRERARPHGSATQQRVVRVCVAATRPLQTKPEPEPEPE